ncbi:MAG: hypothetical protein MRJ92_02705 [Nitrospira sp.]|nr:hypothetical protein [Nitrospira sp.]
MGEGRSGQSLRRGKERGVGQTCRTTEERQLGVRAYGPDGKALAEDSRNAGLSLPLGA